MAKKDYSRRMQERWQRKQGQSDERLRLMMQEHERDSKAMEQASGVIQHFLGMMMPDKDERKDVIIL